MALKVNIIGKGVCLRCQKETEINLQNNLIETNYNNAGKYYFPGDKVILDTHILVDDYAEINNWKKEEKLNVVFNDWDCDLCHLTFQSAMVSLISMKLVRMS